LEAQRRQKVVREKAGSEAASEIDATNRAEQNGSTAASPAGQGADATALEAQRLPEVANEADTTSRGEDQQPR
jgi:hypothetical protein